VSAILEVLADAPGRVAIFDFDGTLIHEDISEAVFQWGVDNRSLPDHPEWPSLDGLSFDVAPMEYYRAVADCASADVPWGHYPGALLLAQAFAGSSLAELVRATDHVVPSLTLRQEACEFLIGLRRMDFDVRIVSAGLAWCVRRFTHNVINPLLRGNGVGEIDLADVWGVTTLLREHGVPRLDRDLVSRGIPYLSGAEPDSHGLVITPFAGGPVAFAASKLALLSEEGVERPTVVVGDGLGDAYLLAHARHGITVGDLAVELSEHVQHLGGEPPLHLVGATAQ
jgi:phosphoserine phosphatase